MALSKLRYLEEFLPPDRTFLGKFAISHTEPQCPATHVARIFTDRADRIPLLVSDTSSNSWINVFVHAPYVAQEEIAEALKNVKVTKLLRVLSDPRRRYSVISLKINDAPLNMIRSSIPWLLLRRYMATKELEEFHVVSFEKQPLYRLRELLSKIGETRLSGLTTMREYKEKEEAAMESTVAPILSRDEEAIFRMAYETGYFDYPRRTKIADLSSRLGLSESALSIKLRRISERLYEVYADRYMR